MFEVILSFIRASRQNLWQLHLSSMNDFAKHFFAYDQLNYARMTTFYLANMMDLKENDVQTCQSISKIISV